MKWGEPLALNTDFWPIPVESAEDAVVTLSRCPLLADWGYVDEGSRVWWTLLNDADRDCKHLKIKTVVQRAVSLHAPQDWET